jgi:hypothetical protein
MASNEQGRKNKPNLFFFLQNEKLKRFIVSMIGTFFVFFFTTKLAAFYMLFFCDLTKKNSFKIYLYACVSVPYTMNTLYDCEFSIQANKQQRTQRRINLSKFKIYASRSSVWK